MEERYIACMMLHGMGDAIGFKNGKWEFLELIEEENKGAMGADVKMYEFIGLGGINYVPDKGWNVSDDTLLHMGTAKSLMDDYSSVNDLGKKTAREYVRIYNEYFVKDKGVLKRMPGETLLVSLLKIRSGTQWDDLSYHIDNGGAGAAMRSSCIGLAYHGLENRMKLIDVSIKLSKITHNSAIGYLGGMTAALFTAFAIEGIDIKQWPFLLLSMFETRQIQDYIETWKNKDDVKGFNNDYHKFVEVWTLYVNTKFNKGKIIRKKTNIHLVARSNLYINNYSKNNNTKFFGSNGIDSCIVAYDALLDSDGKWEKLVIYGMLHSGDGDTTGCITASWYGALYGFGDVPKHRLKYLEFNDTLHKQGKDLYKKYYKH